MDVSWMFARDAEKHFIILSTKPQPVLSRVTSGSGGVPEPLLCVRTIRVDLLPPPSLSVSPSAQAASLCIFPVVCITADQNCGGWEPCSALCSLLMIYRDKSSQCRSYDEAPASSH